MGADLDEKGILVRCSSCGTRNRLRYETLGQETRCGQCKTPLPPIRSPFEINSTAEFKALSRSSLPVLVDFWAPWCGPCKMVAPELEKVAASAAGQLLVAKLNTEEFPELAAQFQVSSIPMMAILREGGEIARTAGARPAAAILSFVHSSITKG